MLNVRRLDMRVKQRKNFYVIYSIYNIGYMLIIIYSARFVKAFKYLHEVGAYVV